MLIDTGDTAREAAEIPARAVEDINRHDGNGEVYTGQDVLIGLWHDYRCCRRLEWGSLR